MYTTKQPSFLTMTEYWMLQGYSKAEAERMECPKPIEAGEFDDDDTFNAY